MKGAKMFDENRPMGGGVEHPNEKQPKGEWIKRPPFWKNKFRAAILFASLLLPTQAQEAKGDSILKQALELAETVLTQEGIERIKKGVESRKTGKIRAEMLAATRAAQGGPVGSELEKIIPVNEPRFEIGNISINGAGPASRYDFWRTDGGATNAIRSMVGRMATSVYGGTVAPDIDTIEETSAKRKRLRRNDEIASETVPGKLTMQVGNVTISGEVIVSQTEKEKQTRLGQLWGRYFGGNYHGRNSKEAELYIAEDAVMVDGSLTFTKVGSEQSQIVAFVGTSGVAVTELDANMYTGKRGISVRTKLSTGTRKFLESLANGIGNLTISLREIKRSRVNEAKMRADNRVHQTGDGEINPGEKKE
ncbi:hypothetical protein CO101_00605 [Candidatus Berkelbacteria bacterium CG_4_9_14_3_um_filter_39_23]|uniref:Uncharacterized protein n=1 Tax=Candidatus Berkelbacteria bacterium CG_4_9_14_3_um_filter_39_23 TaxID=1974508 RepID=A0A2M8C6E6_9BACT|nr:MAG: hypothetical protein CO101_00605 [Candidatus Berkelbacteria bacterium CG_4_9_14_3_um_filter_39_23]